MTLALVSVFLMLSSFNNPIALAEAKIPIQPVYDPLLPVLKHLAKCESSDNPLAVNPHDPDTASYGLYQFKEATWNFYLNKYNLYQNTEQAERMNLIWDRNTQEFVARLVLAEKGGWRNWTNCLRGWYE